MSSGGGTRGVGVGGGGNEQMEGRRLSESDELHRGIIPLME